jgi:hypothetical protein
MYKCIGVGNKIGSDGETTGITGLDRTRRALDTAFAEQSAWRGEQLVLYRHNGIWSFVVFGSISILDYSFWHTSRRRVECAFEASTLATILTAAHTTAVRGYVRLFGGMHEAGMGWEANGFFFIGASNFLVIEIPT